MTDPDPNKLCWIDAETTGLTPEDNLLLEVGFRLTDLDLNEIDRFSSVVGWHPTVVWRARDEAVEAVYKMHTENLLWNASSVWQKNVEEVESQLVGWIHESGAVGLPLSGASHALDKAFLAYHMPTAASLFHYRVIDVSSLKELCRKYNPGLFKNVHEKETDHRVDTCLDGTLAEFAFYIENFIFDGRPEIIALEGELSHGYPVVGQ